MIGVILLGKIPPPYYGPSVATEIILKSSLTEKFDISHLDTRLNTSMDSMGKPSALKVWKSFKMFCNIVPLLLKRKNKVVWIPIAQDRSALLKDAIFILLSKSMGKKVLIHLRGSSLLQYLEKEKKLIRSFLYRVLKLSDAGIVLGTNLKYILRPFLKEENIHVVPNGGNYKVLEKNITDRNKQFQLLYLSNLQRNKGIHVVLKALMEIQKMEGKKIHLTVHGSWKDLKYRDECQDMICQNDLAVTIKPSVSGDEKMKAFQLSDAFVFTPVAPEGHPWAIVEAMACSMPIISTDQGAIIESVIDGQNGYVVETGSHTALASKLLELMRDVELIERMAEKSRQLYLENFTEEKMIKNLEVVLRSTVQAE